MAEVNININAGGNLDDLNKNLNAAGGSVNNLKRELRELTKQLESLDPASEAFVELSERAGEVRDQIKNSAEAINANAGPAFERLGNQFGLVSSKLMTLDFGGAAESMKGFGSALKSIKFSDITKEAGAFFKAIGQFVKTNPLLAIVGVIALIIMNFEKLTNLIPGWDEAMTGVTDEMKKQNELSAKQAQQSKENLDAIGKQEEILKRQGKSEEEILQMKIDAGKQAVENAKIDLQNQIATAEIQEKTAARNKQLMKDILQLTTIPLQGLLYGVDKLIEGLNEIGIISDETFKSIGNLRDKFNEGISNMVFNPEQVKKDGEESVKKAKDELLNLENTLAGFENRKEANAKARRDKAKAEEEKANQDRLAREKKFQESLRAAQEERLNAEEALAEEIYQAGLSAQERELQAVRDAYFEKIELAKQYGLDYAALIEAQKTAEGEINAKYNAQIAASGKSTSEENKKTAQEEFDMWRSNMDFKLGIANDVFNSLISLNEALTSDNEQRAKKNFEITKALGIAQATMDTYAAANTILKDPTYIGPSRWIAFAAAITSGLANVIKIGRTKFSISGGGSAGGGGGVNTPSISSGNGASAPSFNPLNTSFLNNRPDQQPPLQAFVLNTQISSGLEAQERIREQIVL